MQAARKQKIKDSVLERLLRKISPVKRTFTHRQSAYDWLNPISGPEIWYKRKCFNQLLEFLLENNYDIPELREQGMKVTFEEAVGNSAIYGCKEKGDRYVCVNIFVGKNGVVFHIKDDGPGFDYDKIITERRKSLSKYPDELFLYGRARDDFPGGAGISSLLRFADEFRYNSIGNELGIQFALQKLKEK